MKNRTTGPLHVSALTIRDVDLSQILLDYCYHCSKLVTKGTAELPVVAVYHSPRCPKVYLLR